MAFILIIIFGFAFTFVLVSILKTRGKRISDERMKNLGYKPESLVEMGTYIGGHPQLDNNVKNVFLLPKNNELHLVDEFTKILTMISSKDIRDILIEDQTTIEKRISGGRLLTVGLLAFAWQKKEKKELSYLTVDWNDGRFNHQTIFEFSGFDSMTRANKARNAIIRFAR